MKWSWEVVSESVQTTADMLKERGAKKLGCIGFCWGAWIAMHAGQDPSFCLCGGVHPTLFGKGAELGEAVQCPVILLSTKGEGGHP